MLEVPVLALEKALRQIRARNSRVLGECGYPEAARECELRREDSVKGRPAGLDVDTIVNAVLKKLSSS